MILVTGASGFIGRHLLSTLVEAYGVRNVLALTSKPLSGCQYLLHDNFTFEKNFLTKAGYSSVKTIVHAGAFIPRNASQANDWEQCTTNITRTNALLRADLPEVERFILLSTIDVYQGDEIINEESRVAPVSLYGASKLYVEKMITAWAESNHIRHMVLRLGHIYGPGEEVFQKVIPAAMQAILKNQPLKLWGTGNEIRSFIYVKDVINAILACLTSENISGVVNVVGGQKITIKELFDQLILISGQKVPIQAVPADQPGRDLIFDNSKMKKFLLPSETPLREGLTEEWRYMQKLYS